MSTLLSTLAVRMKTFSHPLPQNRVKIHTKTTHSGGVFQVSGVRWLGGLGGWPGLLGPRMLQHSLLGVCTRNFAYK